MFTSNIIRKNTPTLVAVKGQFSKGKLGLYPN